MHIRFDSTIFLILLFLIFQSADNVAGQKQENITGEEIGKQILTNAPPDIQSGSDLDKARYACAIFCDILTNQSTAEENDTTESLRSVDKADSLKSIFHEMGIPSNNTLEIFAGRINQTEETAGNRTNDAILLVDLNNSSSVHAAVALACLDRMYVFDPIMTAGEIDQQNVSESAGAIGMDIRDWGSQMKKAGYSIFREESDSWCYSVEKVEDRVFKRPSCAGQYQAELIPQCGKLSRSGNCSGQSSTLRFIVLPDNKVIGIVEGRDENVDHYAGALSQDRLKGAIYGYYDSRTNRLSFISIMQPHKTEKKSTPLFATYEDVMSGRMQIVDARTPQEFASGAIPGAVNIPLDLVNENGKIKDDASLRAIFADLDRNKQVVAYTNTGLKASSVCVALRMLGYDARLYTYEDWVAHNSGKSG